MEKTRMPKNRDDFEWRLLWAFQAGMWRGYGVDHENVHAEEAEAMKEFALENGLKRTDLR